MGKEKIDIDPKLSAPQREEFLKFCKQLKNGLRGKDMNSRDEYLAMERRAINALHKGKKFHPRSDLYFMKSLIVDLLRQDWELTIRGEKITIHFAEVIDPEQDPEKGKAMTRRRHLLGRNEQLQEKSVAEFISTIERKKLTNKGWFSIFSLMRDGNELAQQLRAIQLFPTVEARENALAEVIQPYIQFVEPNERCRETGMFLSDIWRYFRHTWINEYKSLPGRSMSILIRDAAAPGHPVIGIAALGSSVAQQTRRDEWIGWEGEAFFRRVQEDPSGKYAKWILETLDSLLEEVYLKDFFTQKTISLSDIRKPSPEIINKLRALSSNERDLHIDNPQNTKFTPGNSRFGWADRAESHLFRSKRALMLAELLSIKLTFLKHGFDRGTKRQLEACLEKADFRAAIQKLARKAKSLHVGINIMDIIVCGSIAPYNHLLGGKLVCMLLTSPEVNHYYNERYSSSISLIASSMRGKEVIRKPQLVLLGTTSLYGVGSSQYNRIKIPSKEIGGDSEDQIEYKNLGESLGFGSFHLSKTTIELGGIVAGRESGRTRVNSIFGEGTNPLMRKLKDAMEILGLDSVPILNHQNKRVVYGVALAKNFGDVLLGLAKKPKYLFPQTQPKQKTELIGRFWIKRWLSNRMMNNEVLQQVEEHTLSYPITHGARVPIIDEERQISLFE
jgi:hypothetical protein